MAGGDFFDKLKKTAKNISESAQMHDYGGVIYDFLFGANDTAQQEDRETMNPNNSSFSDPTGFSDPNNFEFKQKSEFTQNGGTKMHYLVETVFSSFSGERTRKDMQSFFDAHPDIIIDGVVASNGDIHIIYHYENQN